MMDPFRYVAPNETTAPKHAAVRAAATEATLLPLHPGEGCDLQGLFAHINERVKAFYDAILEQAPASADRSAAERCCRLARMLANEAVLMANVHSDLDEARRLMSLARDQIMLARMQACAAIALNS
jgi:hypothetical protein